MNSSKINAGFGDDDEDCVGVGAAGVAEFLAGVVEGVGEDGEDHVAVVAADEVEAALVLDELELRRHGADNRELKVNSGTHTQKRRVGHPRRGILRSAASAQDDRARMSATGSIHRIAGRIN